MKRGNPEPLTPELRAELEALAGMPESAINTTEMPEELDWSQALRLPVSAEAIDRVRQHVAQRGLTEDDIQAAVVWARRS